MIVQHDCIYTHIDHYEKWGDTKNVMVQRGEYSLQRGAQYMFCHFTTVALLISCIASILSAVLGMHLEASCARYASGG